MYCSTKYIFNRRAVVLIATTALFVFSDASALNKAVLKRSLSDISKHSEKGNVGSTKIIKQDNRIKKITVTGSTIFKDKIIKLLETVQDHEFTDKLEEDLILKINHIYQSQGYILSYVDDIKFHNSTIKAEIFEGSFREVVINDEKLLQNKLLQKYITKLKSAHPFRNTPEMERTLALMKRIPGLGGDTNYTLEFRPVKKHEINKDHPQTVDLAIRVDYNEFEGSAGINNRHKTNYKKQMSERNNRELEFNGSGINTDLFLEWNNPSKRGDKGILNSSYSGNGDLLSVAAAYNYPINTIGTSINTATSISHSSSYRGTEGKSISLGISHPFYLTRKKSLDVNFDIDTYYEQDKDFNQPTYKIDITKLNLGATFKHKLNKQTKYYLSSEIQQSVRATDKVINDKKTNFTKLVLSGGFEVPIKKLQFSFDTQTQISGKDTPRVEMMQIGQEKGGRGFRSNEIKGNKAVLGSAELSYTGSINHHFFLGYRAYSFLDSGYAKNDKRKISSRIVSSGIGNSLFLRDNIIVTTELAKPLMIDTKFNKPLQRTDKGIKLFGEVAYFFEF